MRRRRQAFTLIEMLVVMAVFSALFGAVILSLYGMFRTSDKLRGAVSEAAQQQRFAAQLRSDAHDAISAKLTFPQQSPTTATTLQLSLADGRIVEYQLQEDQIERRERTGDAVSSIDSFAVSPAIDPGWTVDDLHRTSLLTVYVHQACGSDASVSRSPSPLAIKAALSVACLSQPSHRAGTNTP